MSSNPYVTKVELGVELDKQNQKIDLKVNNLELGINGSIDTTTETTSLQAGVYNTQTSGTYNNASGIVVKEGYYTLLRKKTDGTWVLESEVKIDVTGIQNELDELRLISYKKTDLKPISINLLDYNLLKPNTYIDYTDGIEKILNNYSSSDFIEIEPNTEYSISIPYQLAFYDNERNYISGVATPTTFTTPSNAKYLRTAIGDTTKLRYSLTKSSVKKIYSKSVYGIIENGVRVDKVAGIDLRGLEKNVQNSDILNNVDKIEDSYVDWKDGNVVNLADGFYSTVPIRVKGGATYQFSDVQSQQFAIYDDDFNYIDGYAGVISGNSKTFTTPHNARYISITGKMGVYNCIVEVSGKSLYDKYAIIKGNYISYENGNLQTHSDYSATKHIAIQPNTTYEFGDINVQQLAWFDINHNYISGYAGAVNGYTKTIKSPKNAFYIAFTTLIKDIDSQYLIKVENSKDVEYVSLTAVKNANNWNSIRDLANSIKDANYWKRYTIVVPIGTWNEIDWSGWGDYIKIVGQDRYLTIINTNGISEDTNHIIPDDYMGYGSFAGQQVSTVEIKWKHLIMALRNVNIENMTLKSNNCKYTVHIDSNKFSNVKIKNCNIIEKDSYNAIGIGVWGGQNILFENCIVESLSNNVGGNSAIFLHNSDNQKESSDTQFKNIRIKNAKIAFLDELGSNQSDRVLFENCNSDFKSIKFNSDDVNKPYNLQVIVTNTDVTEYQQNNRPGYMNYNQL